VNAELVLAADLTEPRPDLVATAPFVARALVGFGRGEVDWPFCRAMPMPAVYRLHFGRRRVGVSGPGL
jgi:hypothetical protein